MTDEKERISLLESYNLLNKSGLSRAPMKFCWRRLSKKESIECFRLLGDHKNNITGDGGSDSLIILDDVGGD